MKWINSEKRKPKIINDFNESDYVLGFEEPCGMPVVCWFNSKQNEWYVAHYKSDSMPIKITHWRNLPKNPKRI